MSDAPDPVPADLEGILDQFERAMRSGAPPRLEAFLAAVPLQDPTMRGRLVEELVKLDLEFQWRGSSGPGSFPPKVEDYVSRFPELGCLSEALIGEEYRVRQRWGDRPNASEYLARYPERAARIAEILNGIDEELAAEFNVPGDRVASVGLPTAQVVFPPSSGTPAFLNSLRGLEALPPVQLSELSDLDREGKFADARAAARHAVEQNWLTPYQANLVLQGRGGELVLGSYLLLERLGEGGAGRVFKARHRKMERVAAVKIIRPELLSHAEVVGRFYREIQVLSQLDHPNIVHAYDAGPVGSTHFLAMEYVDGTDLGRLVKQSGLVSVTHACALIHQAAMGLQHAHERGLIHRDIKPHNLLLTRPSPSPREATPGNAIVKVADLGLARLPRAVNQEATAFLTHGTGTLTPQNAALIGTADYLAPEQALDFHGAGAAADIYSLGCTLYFLLAGQPPFAGCTLTEKLLRHQQHAPPELSRFRQDVPAGLELLVRTMLAKDPAHRPSAAAVAEALLCWTVGGSSVSVFADLEAGSATDTLPLALPVEKPNAGRPYVSRSAMALAVVLGLGTIGTLIWHFARVIPAAERGKDSLTKTSPSPPTASKSERPPKPSKNRTPLDVQFPKGFVGEVSHTECPSRLSCLAVAPNGRRVVVGGVGHAYLLDIKGWKTIRAIERQDLGAVRSVAFSPDGERILTGCEGDHVWLWERDIKTPVEFTPRPHGFVRGVAFSPDGKQLAACGGDGSVRCWDIARPAEPRTLQQPNERVAQRGIAFCSQGKGLISAGHVHADGRDASGAIWRWNLASGLLTEYPRAKGIYQALTVSSDGTRLLASGDAGVLRLLDVNGKTDRQLTDAPYVFAIAWAPGGGHVLAAGAHKEIRLWSLATATVIHRFSGHSEVVTGLAFSPDGRFALSCSIDRTVRLWSMPEEVWHAAERR